MNKYLLAAEADKIQDIVFRSAYLQSVVGGSQLLTRFCNEALKELIKTDNTISVDPDKVNDGGAFRLLINSEDEKGARRFGEILAELYHVTVGGHLTVAEPVPENGNFVAANQQVQKNLRTAKQDNPRHIVGVQLPYAAFCASCGQEISNRRYAQRENERQLYYCEHCYRKQQEREAAKKDTSPTSFLGRFRTELKVALNDAADQLTDDSLIINSEEVGKFDLTGRNYVGYLLADGNSMGLIFDQCQTPEQMTRLSKSLSDVLYKSLARPVNKLMKRIGEANFKHASANKIPVLPIILGGDDLFALLPASWAIDFAIQFCKNYEQLMTEKLKALQLFSDENKPTIAAAVVICKANYPHTLAHRQGDLLLKQAKSLSQSIAGNYKEYQQASVVNFALITGNQMISQPVQPKSIKMLPTARPYFIDESQIQKFALPINRLLEQRLKLKSMPGKRRIEMESYYYDVMAEYNKNPSTDEKIRPGWKQHIDGLLKRIGKSNSKVRAALEIALTELGDSDFKSEGFIRYFGSLPNVRNMFAHGICDLIELWDFLYQLSTPLQDYKGE